jgi:hypothetical protein
LVFVAPHHDALVEDEGDKVDEDVSIEMVSFYCRLYLVVVLTG